jgi:hypothetical protein
MRTFYLMDYNKTLKSRFSHSTTYYFSYTIIYEKLYINKSLKLNFLYYCNIRNLVLINYNKTLKLNFLYYCNMRNFVLISYNKTPKLNFSYYCNIKNFILINCNKTLKLNFLYYSNMRNFLSNSNKLSIL